MHLQQGKWVRRLLAPVIALLVAAGCGGVDSGGTGAVVSVGPISGFGSIIVNGVRFDESSATIQDDDGNAVTRDRLLLGVMTRIDGSTPNNLQQSDRSHRSMSPARLSAFSVRPSSSRPPRRSTPPLPVAWQACRTARR